MNRIDINRDHRISNPLPVANLGPFPHTFITNTLKGQSESICRRLPIVRRTDKGISNQMMQHHCYLFRKNTVTTLYENNRMSCLTPAA